MKKGLILTFLAVVILLTFSTFGATYVGVNKCKMCHKLQYDSWLKTPMAKAYEKLPAADKTKKECIACHTVNGDVNMPGVQCESCHGPGSDYAVMSIMKDPAKSKANGLIIPDEKVCVGCHNKKSPNFKGFNYAQMVTKVHEHKKK